MTTLQKPDTWSKPTRAAILEGLTILAAVSPWVPSGSTIDAATLRLDADGSGGTVKLTLPGGATSERRRFRLKRYIPNPWPTAGRGLFFARRKISI